MQTMLTVSDWQSLLLGIGIGGISILIVYAFIYSRTKRVWQDTLSSSDLQLEREQSENGAIRQQLELLQNEAHQYQLKVTRLEERLLSHHQQNEQLTSEKLQLERKLEQALFQLADRNEVIAETEARLESERVAHNDKLKMLEDARSQLKQEFQNLANRIFDEKAQRFTQSNTENMGHLLNPLKEQIGEFKRRVEDAYDKEAKDRRALYEQIGHLKQLNQQMSADAINLTNALKGENKTQGNWGEVVLERALEESGLRKGHEFELQVSVAQGNKRYQPDAIIRLPDGKDIIVDAKVSLTAYEQYCSVESVDKKARLLKEHLLSIRGHIKGLGDKAYQTLDGVRSLDFVLLFIPVEGAFLLALEKEPGLFKDAFDRNIMLVSPSTLMVTLRTIHNIWRYEHQNQNAKEIARRGGELHDKFVGFVESVDEIGRNLNRTQQAFDTAHKRLSSGRGNLINQVAMLKELGADGKKQLSADLIEKASEEDC